MISRHTRSLFLIAFGHLVIELCSQFLPVVYPVLISNLGLNYTQVGVLAMVASVGTSLAQPLFGYLSDRWSPQRMSALSVAWLGLIMGLVGLMNSYPWLAVVIGLGMLGSAAFHPSGATIASTGGGARRGVAISVFSVGGSLGSALSPLLVTAGMQWLGMRGTVTLIPVALLFSSLLYWQLGQVAPSEDDRSAGRKDAAKGKSLVGLALIILAVMCLAWFQISFRTYLPIWIESRGQSLAAGGRILFVFLAFLGVGGLAGGTLSDRIGRWQLLVLSLGLLGPAMWFFVSAAGPAQAVLAGVMGVLIGATFPVSIVMAQETWSSGVGVASGLVMGLGWVPGGIGASFTGYVADRLSLETGMRLLVVPVVLGTACILAYAAVQRASSSRECSLTPGFSGEAAP